MAAIDGRHGQPRRCVRRLFRLDLIYNESNFHSGQSLNQYLISPNR
jgi:hypothetical protein